MKQNTYLFIFTIGPVHKFIAAARTTHDLFIGSEILSTMCATAIETFNNYGEIIIPQMVNGNSSLPNRFIGKITEEKNIKAKNVEEIAEEINSAILVNFQTEIDKISKLKGFNIKNNQIENFFERLWVAVPVIDGYANAYGKLEKDLFAIKSTNRFEQFKYSGQIGEEGRKCNIEGENNIVIYRQGKDEILTEIAGYNRKLQMHISGNNQQLDVLPWNDEKKIKIWELKEGEGLSAISLLKRIYKNDPHKQPSTTRIALMHLFDKIKDWDEFKLFKVKAEGWSKQYGWSSEENVKYQDIEYKMGKFLRHSNDELWFNDNINEKVFKKLGNYEFLINIPPKNVQDKIKADVKSALAMHQAVTKRIKNENLNLKFTKYYGMIASDGDNMGDWLTGRYLMGNADLETYQKKLSTAITDYANENQGLDAPYGKTIYAGGEDYLGFVNIHFMFDILKGLHERYTNKLKDINTGISLKSEHSRNEFTITAAVVIAHYKEPLSQVVKQTFDLEKEAKQIKDKNSFAITVSKHSGSDVTIIYKWMIDGKYTTDIIKEIAKNLETNFSNTFIIQLFDLYEMLDGVIPTELWENEIERLIKRSIKENGKSDKGIKTKKLTEAVLLMWNIDKDYSNFLNMLGICDFMNKKTGK